MAIFDLSNYPAALLFDISSEGPAPRREAVFQPLRAKPDLTAGDCLTVTLTAPQWARSVIAMQTTPDPSAGHHLSLEVGGSDTGGIATPLPGHPAGAPAGGARPNVRGVIVSDSIRLNLTLSKSPSALEVRVVFLDH